MANSWREALAAMRTRCRGYRGATGRQRMPFIWRVPLSRASLGSLLPSVSCLKVSAYVLELILPPLPPGPVWWTLGPRGERKVSGCELCEN